MNLANGNHENKIEPGWKDFMNQRNFAVVRFSICLFVTLLAALIGGLGSAFGDDNSEKADLILVGGTVVTVDATKPEAEAVAFAEDRILFVGSNEDAKKLAHEKTEIVELDGELVIPGLIESHAHFMNLGESKLLLDLTTAKSWDDIIKMVEEAARTTPPGEWIVGQGWHQEKWSKKPEPNIDGYPDHQALSRVSPNHPVLLRHASGHMCFANGYAMRQARVSNDTRDPSGGEILRNESGEAIGVFRETAQSRIYAAMARSQANPNGGSGTERLIKVANLAQQECLANGITSFQDAGSSFGMIEFFRKLAEEKKLNVRLYVMVRGGVKTVARLKKCRTVGFGNHFLTVRGIKHSIDGALGAHGAWLLAPYEDLPRSAGLNTTRIDVIKNAAKLALECDFQLCVHAIGDRANREVLDIFEEAFKSKPTEKSRRWRVEHAQHLHPDDIERFAKLGVIASMQGVHCTSDAPYVPQRLGMRRSKEGAYVWQSLLKSGAVICNGTDAPVEKIDPIASFYASVTRRLENGVTFFPEQCMTREQALRSYTLDAAYAAFEEEIKGSITPGKLGDVVVLTKNIMTCPDDQIRDAKVRYTIVGGKIRYDSKKDSAAQEKE